MTWVTQEAEVIAPANKGQVQIKACTTKGCGSCSLAGGCGQGLLSGWLAGRAPSLTLHTSLALQPGDTILVGLETTQLNKAALVQFLLPLLTLLGAAMLAELLGITSSSKLFLIALAGLFSGLLLARLFATSNQLKLLHPLSFAALPPANHHRS